MKAFEAAKVLFRAGQEADASALLQKVWDSESLRGADEFPVFCALVEIWAHKDPRGVVEFLDCVLAGEGPFQDFASRRDLSQQSILLDWQGQVSFSLKDFSKAFESLSRAASLGRDTSLIWRQLGSIYIENGELELGLRYIRRSLHLYRQLDLDLLSGRDEPFGEFVGFNPVGGSHGLEDFLELLLTTTRLAKGQRNLKAVRELVLEMIHQFPHEPRLPKIRLLMERAIVESSLTFAGLGRPQLNLQASPQQASLRASGAQLGIPRGV